MGYSSFHNDVILIDVENFYLVPRGNPGLASLAASLRSRDFTVRIFEPSDFTALSRDGLLEQFKRAAPFIAGFYTNSDNIFQVRQWSRYIRRALPSVRIVAGGPLATALGSVFLEENPDFDAVIAGEGEIALPAYAAHIVRGAGTAEEIPSLFYRCGSHILSTPRAPYIEDVESLPLPAHGGEGARHFTITSGRGCPFGCAFCSQGVHGKNYRYRSPDSVIREIVSAMERLDAVSFTIADDTFVANPARAAEICERLIEYRKTSGRDFIFFCEGRVDIFSRHRELLPLMRSAGLLRLQFGIESGDQRVVDAYGKGILLDQVDQVLEHVAQLGDVSAIAHFILGGAFETEETAEKTIETACRLLKTYPGVFETGAGCFSPYPGTPISRDPAKYDIEVLEYNFPNNISTLDPTCRTRELTLERIRLLKQDFTNRVNETMEQSLVRIPFERIRSYFSAYRKYGITNFWFNMLREKPTIADYFRFLESPRFFRLRDVLKFRYEEIVPLRSNPVLYYDGDGRSLLVVGGLAPLRISDEQELFLYRRSCGKQNLETIAGEFCSRWFPGAAAEEIVRSHILPFYEKLEKLLYVIFYV